MVNKKSRYLRWILLAFAILIFFFAILWWIRLPVQTHFEDFSKERTRLEHILKTKGTVTIDDVDSLQPWMTFEYINRLFSLPPAYLQEQLNITDPKYPRVTLSHYSKKEKLKKPELLNHTQDLIRDYLTK